MNSIGQTHSTIVKAILVAAIALPLAVFSTGCKGKKARSASREQGNGPVARLFSSDKVTDSLPDKVCEEIFGKASLAGEKYIGELSDLAFPVNDSLKALEQDFYYDIDLCALEDKFADDIFLDFEDGVARDTFALAVKELYDRNAVASYYISLYEVRVTYEMFYCDSATASKHPTPFDDSVRPSKKRLAQVFPDRKMRGFLSSQLNQIRRSPDYALIDIADSLANYPYAYEFPFDTLRLRKAEGDLSEYYDKSSFVPDIERFQNCYASDDSTTLIYDDPVSEIVSRLNPEMDFDQKCIYAIELSHLVEDQYKCLDVLGSLIESREYSRYLYEVWDNWRAITQTYFFGSSNESPIPNAYYTKIRGICANTMIRYIQKHPDDDGALLRLFCLIYEIPIHRGWAFGNYVIPLQYNLKMKGVKG